jgi:PGF-pre-PGF domain-containing protein
VTVQATDEADLRVNSSTITINVDTTSPTPALVSPANAATNADALVLLNFTSSDNLDTVLNYTIYINGTANATGLAGNGTWTNVSIVFADGAFAWRVQLLDEALNTVNSTTNNFTVGDTTAPITAPVLNYVNDSDVDGNIELTWTADSNAASYKVYRDSTNITNLTSKTSIATVTATSFEDNTTTSGTDYWYALTSVDAAGNENTTVLSASYNVTASDTIKPMTSANMSTSTNDDGSVLVAWAAVYKDVSNNGDLAITYRVFRGASAAAINTSLVSSALGNTTGTTYTDTSITTNTTYYYIVTTIDDGGNYNSSNSSNNTVSATPSDCAEAQWGTWSSWSTCSSSSQSRTRTRTCYGGGGETETGTQSCTSGSSGGGGGSNLKPLLQGQTKFMGTLAEGETATFTSNSGSGGVVDTITFTAGAAGTRVELNVNPLATRPVSQEIRGKSGGLVSVYSYLEVRIINLQKVGGATIEFTVPEEWLSDKDPNSVALYRYTDGAWNRLSTISKGNGKYSASTPGFSFFAIGAEADAAVTVPSSQPPTAVPDVTQTPPSTNAAPTDTGTAQKTGLAGQATDAAELAKTGSSGAYLWGIGLIVVILAIFMVWMKRSNKGGHHS